LIVVHLLIVLKFISDDRKLAMGIMNRKNGRVDLLIWSGLNSVTKTSGGRFTLVDHFNSKAAVTEHARNSGLPFVHVQAGFYASNFKGGFEPRKQPDGSYILAVPCRPSAAFPAIDVVQDYDIFVREAIESPAFGADTEILSCRELIPIRDSISQLAESKPACCASHREENHLRSSQ